MRGGAMKYDPAWKGPGWVRGARFAMVTTEAPRVAWEEWVAIIIAAVMAGAVLWVAVVK